MPRLALWLLLPLLWLGGFAQAESGDVQPVPALSSRVTDLAGLLDSGQRQALEAKLAAFEQQKGSQIAVLIVHTTKPEDVFSYSFRVADSWKLGRKGVDDGVLMVVAVDDHADNIQVGYGLEGALPDARCKQILQDIMAPLFRNGDYAGGISAGVDAIIKVVNGEPLPAASHRSQRGGQAPGGFIPGLFAGIFAAAILHALLGRTGAGLAGGGIAALVAFMTGAALFSAIGVGVLIALGVWIGLLGNGGFGGFWGGGFGGGRGGGFGGGGFGGGGGGFGGGGSSGNW
jgi:uncharacterized protein